MLKPVTHKHYFVEGAPYPSPPIRSGILLGSSGQGKSHLLLSLLMGPYKGLHSRAIIVSPSARVDPLWQVWTIFVRDNYEWSEEKTMFDHYDENALREISNTHQRINMEVKRRHKGRGKCKLFSLCIFFDNRGDNRFHDSHGLIAEACFNHRHNYAQAICNAQSGCISLPP